MTNDKKITLRKETSITNVGNQIVITNKILNSINDVQFSGFGTFTDPRDGNVYKTVKIGEQVWMAENLRYIPFLVNNKTHEQIRIYDYNGYEIERAKSTLQYKKYGCLYEGSSIQPLSPKGWHIPSVEEWEELINFLGGPEIAGEKLKSNSEWNSPIIGVIESGFCALPGGFYEYGGFEYGEGYLGVWLSCTDHDRYSACYYYTINSNSPKIFKKSMHWESGISIRCIKDFLD